jgi:hypothetical protein
VISAALCDSYRLELLQGLHQTGDTYKIALFLAAASLGSATTEYAPTSEAAGAGYTAGGASLVGLVTGHTGSVAWLSFDDPTWPASTITARGALIYNATRADRAVAVLDFSTDRSSSNGTFTVQFPTADADYALIRIT